MASYQAFLKTGDLHWKNECIIHIDYYLSLAVSYKKSDYTVLNLYPISLYDINYKWPSALSLGVALSLMVRLYENFGLKKYLSSAENLLTNFFLEVKDGGVQRKYRIDKNQSIVILEEYPSSQLSGVLNGHISGLWGLYDLGRHIERSNQLFIELSNQLADNLNLWDGNYWSLYDINYLVKNKKNYASIHYHMLHIKQLFVMYLITNNRRYAEFSEKFIANKYGIISRLKAFLNKVFFRLT